MDSQFWKNTVRISHLSAQWFLLLQNLSRYMQLVDHSAHLHPVLQQTRWWEDLVKLLNWNMFFAVEACTDLTFLFIPVF